MTSRRGGRGEAPADELTMQVLLRLWAGDVPVVDGDDLVLVATGVEVRVVIPVAVVDDLEYGRGWVRDVAAGRRARVTYRGAEALADWLARRRPAARAAINPHGDRLELRRRKR